MDKNPFDPSMMNPAALIAAMGFGLVFILVVFLAISAVICWLVVKLYEAIPEKHRAMPPNKVWLMMIPCFNVVWSFWVFPGLSKSFKSYFDSVGDNSVGDCYAQIALWLCITMAASMALFWAPCLNYIVGLASLVLLILYLVKAYDLKAKIKA